MGWRRRELVRYPALVLLNFCSSLLVIIWNERTHAPTGTKRLFPFLCLFADVVSCHVTSRIPSFRAGRGTRQFHHDKHHAAYVANANKVRCHIFVVAAVVAVAESVFSHVAGGVEVVKLLFCCDLLVVGCFPRNRLCFEDLRA